MTMLRRTARRAEDTQGAGHRDHAVATLYLEAKAYRRRESRPALRNDPGFGPGERSDIEVQICNCPRNPLALISREIRKYSPVSGVFVFTYFSRRLGSGVPGPSRPDSEVLVRAHQAIRRPARIAMDHLVIVTRPLGSRDASSAQSFTSGRG